MKAAEDKAGGRDKHIRAFIAIELEEGLKDKLTAIQKALRANLGRGISWTKPETMHLTIKFLGNIDTSRMEGISAALKDATADTKPFELTARGLGAFPSKARPSTLWVGIEKSLPLEGLFERIESRLKKIGLEREKKGLHPHLTLARVRRSSSNAEAKRGVKEALEGFKEELSYAFTVRKLVLIKSEPHKGGVTHTPIRHFNLENLKEVI